VKGWAVCTSRCKMSAKILLEAELGDPKIAEIIYVC
jgi:hypothetical protein